MRNSDFRKRLGLQFFAEADTGGAGADAGAEPAGVEDDFLAAFDMDEGEPAAADGEAAEAETADTGAEAEPGAAGGAGGEQAADNPQDTAAEGERAEAQAAPVMVALDVGGQAVQVPADAVQALSAALGQDVAALLAKGGAYDQRAARELRVLDEYAKEAGVTTEEYLDFLEQQRDEQFVAAEVEKIRGNYPEGTPDEALQAIAERNVADRRAQEAVRRAAEEAQRQQAQADAAMQPAMQDARAFLSAHPEIKSAADVPQGVWDIVKNQRVTLPVAYERYQAEQVRAELEQTREQLRAAQKMSGNRAQAVGSMSGQADGGRDEIASILLS